METALLMLEDGHKFYGTSIGVNGEVLGEIVFNTSMTGYQEIITDPSYAHQIVTLTYPHIGNVGINKFDNESDHVYISGMVIRNLTINPSNFRCTSSLSNFLIKQNTVGISNIDTRKLTRIIRKKGIQYACIIAYDKFNPILATHRAQEILKSNRFSVSYQVSTSHQYIWNQGTCWNQLNTSSLTHSTAQLYHVIVYDFGVKHSIMRILVDYGCVLTVVPLNTPVQEILDMNPDGIFLSNGPGDPSEYTQSINLIKFFFKKTNIPIFGICLGYQLLAIAGGAKTIKMKFGHHGSNHPVKDIENDRVIITSQNHNFVVDMVTLPSIFKITHTSLFDKTLQGICHVHKPVFGFQGHPEANPGPHDGKSIFNYFIKLIKEYRNKK